MLAHLKIQPIIATTVDNIDLTCQFTWYENFHCKFDAGATDLSKNSEKIAIYFPKKGRGGVGGVRGCSEFFSKIQPFWKTQASLRASKKCDFFFFFKSLTWKEIDLEEGKLLNRQAKFWRWRDCANKIFQPVCFTQHWTFSRIIVIQPNGWHIRTSLGMWVGSVMLKNGIAANIFLELPCIVCSLVVS